MKDNCESYTGSDKTIIGSTPGYSTHRWNSVNELSFCVFWLRRFCLTGYQIKLDLLLTRLQTEEINALSEISHIDQQGMYKSKVSSGT